MPAMAGRAAEPDTTMAGSAGGLLRTASLPAGALVPAELASWAWWPVSAAEGLARGCCCCWLSMSCFWYSWYCCSCCSWVNAKCAMAADDTAAAAAAAAEDDDADVDVTAGGRELAGIGDAEPTGM